MNLYLGNPAPGSRVSIGSYLRLGESPGERERAARAIALDSIAERLPKWPFEKMSELRALFVPTSIVVRRMLAPLEAERTGRVRFGQWRYRFTWSALDSERARHGISLLTALVYIAVAILGVAGLVLADGGTVRTLFLFYALAHIAPTLLTFATSRFRLPLMPLLLIGTAVLLVSRGEVWRSASWRRRGLAVGLAVAMAGLLLWGRAAFLSPVHF